MTVTSATTLSTAVGLAVPHVLAADELSAASAILARAFATDPGIMALVPDECARLRLLELSGPLTIAPSIRRATVYGIGVDETLAAVAVWKPPGAGVQLPVAVALPNLLAQVGIAARHAPHFARLLRTHRRSLLGLGRERARAVRTASRGPSWHLAYLATDPECHGRGLASRLLSHVLDRCDTDGLAAWLETTNPANIPLYERFGFTTIAAIEDAAWLPGFWAMRREPVSSPDSA